MGKDKRHLNKELEKSIVLRSILIKKANKTKSDVDIAANKKQWNYAIALNKKAKYNRFNNLGVNKETKLFCKICKPFFSNKHSMGMLV